MLSSESPGEFLPLPPDGREGLLARIASLGARPFGHQVVESPWNAVVEVESLHQRAKQRVRALLDGCSNPEANRCLTAHAPSGYGKTHLLAWTRQLLDERDDAVFIHVPPYTPENGLLEARVLRATLDALRLRSHRQSELFARAVRNFLVDCYDRLIEGGQNFKDLGAGSFWRRLLRPATLKIAGDGKEDQFAALQRAFARRALLCHAFASFEELHPPVTDGVRPDWDAFVAACLLACGNTRQRWHADRWFRNEPMPPDVREPFHLDRPCEGAEKIRNGLFTLNRLVNQVFCVAFDQMEDTYLAIEKAVGDRGKVWLQVATAFRSLMTMPGFCLLFTFQTSIWSTFRLSAPPMLTDRMVAGDGPEELKALDDATACELVRQRMEALVWKQLPLDRPPPDAAFFPFTEADIRQLRLEASSELRTFLRFAQDRYDAMLQRQPETPKCPRIKVTHIEPAEIVTHEPTALLIHGAYFPADVEVYFGEHRAERVVCRPEQGQIDVTSPTGLLGEVMVCVRAEEAPANEACRTVTFIERPSPRPYYKHIDRVLLRKRREELRLTQTQVAERMGTYQTMISRLERNKWDPPDDLFARLAELYERPLSSFERHRD